MVRSVRNYLLLLPLLAGCSTGGADLPTLEAREGMASIPAGVSSMAFYVQIENRGSDPDTLVALAVPGAESATIHTMTMEGGMHRMEEVPFLPLPAGEVVALRPGGHHGMIEWETPPEYGDSIEVTLRFTRSEDLTLRIPVISPLELP